jgi:hypothetical protein
MAWSIKRKFPRINLIMKAEMRSSLKNFPYRGQTVTVGEGGCYVEILETMMPSTMVDVVLWSNGEKVQAKAQVVSNDRHIGNGIKFVHMTEEDAEKLRTCLKTARQKTPADTVAPVAPVAPDFEVTRFTLA